MADKRDSYCATHNTSPVPGDPCWQCINAHTPKDAKEALIEASYKISSDIFKRVPKTRTIGFIRGYQKAGTIAHDVLKKMIEEAK